MIEVKIKLKLPRMPNFLMIDEPDPKRAAQSIAVGKLSDSELNEIGRKWTEALIEHAEKMRKLNKYY